MKKSLPRAIQSFMARNKKNRLAPAGPATPPPTLGAILRGAREARGIPIEMAAHATKIRASRLKELEADDLSGLPPAYRRYFVTHYAKYLQVPIERIRDYLPEADAFGVDGYTYLENAASEISEPEAAAPRRNPRRRPSSLRAALALLGLLLALGAAGQGALLLKKLERARAVEDRAALEATPQTRYPEEFVAVGDPPAGSLARSAPTPAAQAAQ